MTLEEYYIEWDKVQIPDGLTSPQKQKGLAPKEKSCKTNCPKKA
jgi:hypothetical protein